MAHDCLTIREAARRLGLQESTLRKWILLRKIGVVRLGRAVRLRSDEVEALIKQNYTAAMVKGQ